MSNLANNTTTLQSILEGVDAIPELVFDTAPTAGSQNPVTSEGIKQYVDGALANVGCASGVTATLTTNWTEQADGSFAQTVSVEGVTADNQVVVDCNLTGSDMAADVEVMTAWGCITRCSQAEGTLTFYCYGDAPTVAIPLNAVVM